MELSVSSMKKMIGGLLGRYHIVLFVVLCFGGLAIAVFSLNHVINTSTEANGYTSNINNVSLDRATIEKLRALKTTGEETQKLEVSGRANPFVE